MRPLKRTGCWKAKLIPSRARSVMFRWVISCPLKMIWPPVGCSMPIIRRAKVVLPLPLGPVMTTKRLSGSCRLTSCNICRLSTANEIFLSSSIGFSFQLVSGNSAERQQQAADSVAERHYQQPDPSVGLPPKAGHWKVKHIGHAVLKTAQNENGNPEEEAQILAQLMPVGAEAFHGDIH